MGDRSDVRADRETGCSGPVGAVRFDQAKVIDLRRAARANFNRVHTSLWDIAPGEQGVFPYPGLITTRFLFSRLQEPFREDFFRNLVGRCPRAPTLRCYIEISGLLVPMVL